MATPPCDYGPGSPGDLGRIELDRLYGIPQAAFAIGVHYETLREWVKEGGIPHRLVKKRKKIIGSDLLAAVGGRPAPRLSGEEDRRRRRDAVLASLPARRPRRRRKAEPATPAGRAEAAGG